MIIKARVLFATLLLTVLAGCSSNDYPSLPTAAPHEPFTTSEKDYKYLIGPGDVINVFVWRNPDVSSSVVVRPDGKITTPLVEDVVASGKTPAALARQIEKVLEYYIKDPIVSVTVEGFVGPFSEQIRVVGEAAQPQALSYRQNMTLLDVMIAVGGLTDFADGDDALLIRVIDGQFNEYSIQLDELIKDGNIRANAAVLPGDIIIIPDSWF